MINIKKLDEKIWVLLACIVISLIGYHQIIDAFFSSDDFAWIHQMKTKGAFHVWMSEPHIYFRPITSLTFFLDYTIWGLNPIGYHLTSLLFHSLCAFQLYITTSLLLEPLKIQENSARIISLLATFIFLILPSHAEAVSWISARSDLIFTFFCLTAFNLYLAFRKTNIKIYFLISYLSYFAALLSKETAIIYPGLILIYEIYYYLTQTENQNINRVSFLLRIFGSSAIYTTLFPIYFLIRYLRINRFIGGQGASVHLDFTGEVVWKGLSHSLRIIIPAIPGSSEQLWQILFCICAVFLLGLCLFLRIKDTLYRKFSNLIILLVALSLLTLLPMINLWLSVTTYENERLLYFSSVFVSILVALLVGLIYFSRKCLFVIAVAILTVFWSVNLYYSTLRWQAVGQISSQILEDIKSSKIEIDRTLFVNIPDNLNGSYIYMSSFNEAIELFDKTQHHPRSHVLLYQHLTHPKNAIEILKYAQNKYYIQSKEAGAAFLNRYLFPLDKEFGTDHHHVQNLDENSYSTYDLEFLSSHFKNIAYYSNGKLGIKDIPSRTSPIQTITNPRLIENELGFLSPVNLNEKNFDSISGNMATPNIQETPLIVDVEQEIKLDHGVINLPISLNKDSQKLSVLLSYGEQKIFFTQGELYSEEDSKSSQNSKTKTLKWRAAFPAKVLPWFGITEIQAWVSIPEKKLFLPLSETVSVRVIPNQISSQADFVSNPSEIYGYIDQNYNVLNGSLIRDNHATRLTITGWARLRDQKQQPDQVYLSFNDEPSFFATADVKRESPDIVEAFNSNLYSHARWLATFSTQFLPLGITEIKAWVYDPIEKKFFKLSKDFKIRVFPEKVSLNQQPRQNYGYIDIPQATEQPITINGNKNLILSGWAILPNLSQQPEQVYFSYGEQPTFFATTNINLDSQDVAEALNSKQYTNSRWKAELSTSFLPSGETVIKAWIYNPKQQQLVPLKNQLTLIKP